jgi:RNA-directed DNA polymerase
VSEQKPAGKPFEIPKQEVWDAWLKVKANGGAPGADGQSIEDFEAGLKSNLYKVWNRMSSGSYFPNASGFKAKRLRAGSVSGRAV